MKVTTKKALLIGLASSTLFGMAGCTTNSNMHGDVYGPNPYLEDEMNEEDNIPPAVYGPPIDEETTDEELEDAEETVEETAEDESGIEEENQ